jgi:hypothetical protein
MLEYDGANGSVAADATPLYQEHYPDTLCVRRRSTLCHQRFWLIEDLVAFERKHDVTARWYLRPELQDTTAGVCSETAEGVRLYLLPLLGPDDWTSQRVAGYPDRLDGSSVRVDFRQRGSDCRWLWLAWADATRREEADVHDGWQAAPDPDQSATVEMMLPMLRSAQLHLRLTAPPHQVADVPPQQRWWFRRMVTAPERGGSDRWWLRLPRQMVKARVWINGEECPFDDADHLRMQLVQPHIPMPPLAAGSEAEVIVCCDVGAGQEPEQLFDKYEIVGFSGRPAVLVATAAAGFQGASYDDGMVIARGDGRDWRVEYQMMSAQSEE